MNNPFLMYEFSKQVGLKRVEKVFLDNVTPE